MPTFDEVAVLLLLASSAFFVALSFGLLVRYRRLSQRISVSSDLGRDLWQALEQRMRKQDERILDVLGRLEVVQARVVATSVVKPTGISEPASSAPSVSARPSPPLANQGPEGVIQAPLAERQTSQVTTEKSQVSQRKEPPLPGPLALDETHLAAIRLLGDGPKSTRQLTDALGKSREHTARMMKELFEGALVGRNAATKPFVYQLTEEGRRRLDASRA